MPEIRQLVGGTVEIVDRPDGGANIVWNDQLGNAIVTGVDAESRKILGPKLTGSSLVRANGSVPRTDEAAGADLMRRRPQG